ncbi:MAG: CDP-alcohol phosphatidyltransferase family protein [Candidatus Thorarchaeota archaeon]|nr:CDP-alcohol phosphatidyltransferase family protein [Candidatus Thorarchaeota archaeon]
MLGRFRERYQRAMMPVGRLLAKTGITPNGITTLTLLVALLAAYLFYLGELLLGLVTMLVTVFMDMLDGAVARAANLASKFGATYDHTLDRYAEYLFVLGLMMGPVGNVTIPWWPYTMGDSFLPWFWGTFALFGMVMASFTRAKAESVGGMKSCTVGVAERQEKLMLTFAGILLLALSPSNLWMDFLALFPGETTSLFASLRITNILTVCIVLVGILSHITVIQRLAYARKMIPLAQQEENPHV